MKPAGLPPALRVKRRSDFQRVFAARVSFREGQVIAYLQPNGLAHARVGTAVGKKGRTAPLRNRLRRVLREAWRLEREALPPGLDWILVVPKTTRELALEPTRASLRRLAQKARRRFPDLFPGLEEGSGPCAG